jgi:hypothetical protein
VTSIHRRSRLALAALAGALVTTACLPGNIVEPEYHNPPVGRAVLFIGNSLTYVNDVPLLVQGIADAAGGDSLIIAMVAGPDMALIDHWRGNKARETIASRHWDNVVLQQGPSSTTINRDSLRLVAKMFEPSITAAGAKVVLFSAWPAVDRRQDFTRAAESYPQAAEDVGGLYAPVANAWVEAWTRDPQLNLYSDGLHANVAGSYLAALTIYARLMGKSPVGLPASFRLRDGNNFSLPSALTTLLQESAWAAVAPTLPP